MKRILVLLLLFCELATGQIKISEFPTFIGDPTGSWVPIVISGTNRKIDAKYIGRDSIDVKEGLIFDTLYYYRNGVKQYYKLTRAGQIATAGNGLIKVGTEFRFGRMFGTTGGELTYPTEIPLNNNMLLFTSPATPNTTPYYSFDKSSIEINGDYSEGQSAGITLYNNGMNIFRIGKTNTGTTFNFSIKSYLQVQNSDGRMIFSPTAGVAPTAFFDVDGTGRFRNNLTITTLPNSDSSNDAASTAFVKRLAYAGQLGWSLTGNSGINSATQFLGTTDAQPLILRTNNTERARFFSNGNISLGRVSTYPVTTIGANVQLENDGVVGVLGVVGRTDNSPTGGGILRLMQHDHEGGISSPNRYGVIDFGIGGNSSYAIGTQIESISMGGSASGGAGGKLIFKTKPAGGGPSSMPFQAMEITDYGQVGIQRPNISGSSPAPLPPAVGALHVRRGVIGSTGDVEGTASSLSLPGGFFAGWSTGASTPLPNAADQKLGSYDFGRLSGSATVNVTAGIGANSSEAWGASSFPTYLTYGTTPTGSTTPVERMRIAANGNIGVGTTNPTYKLHIVTNDNRQLALQSTSPSGFSGVNLFNHNGNRAGAFGTRNSDGSVYLLADSTPFNFYTTYKGDPIARFCMQLKTSGRVLIGPDEFLTDTTNRLTVDGTAKIRQTLTLGNLVTRSDETTYFPLVTDASGAISIMNRWVASGSSGIADPGSNGLLARTALNTSVARTITGTTNLITVTNGDGLSGNPTINVGSNVVQTTGNQTLAGIKSFSDRVVITKGAGVTPDVNNLLYLGRNEPGNFYPLFIIEDKTDDGYAQFGYWGKGRKWNVGVGNGASSFFNVADKYYVLDATSNTVRFVIDGDGKTGMGGITSPTAFLHLPAGTTNYASLRIPETSNDPTSPNAGDVWNKNGQVTVRTGGANKVLNDFEAGTYNPTFSNLGTGVSSVVATNSKVWYTRVGKTVTITGRVDPTFSSGSSGDTRTFSMSLPPGMTAVFTSYDDAQGVANCTWNTTRSVVVQADAANEIILFTVKLGSEGFGTLAGVHFTVTFSLP